MENKLVEVLLVITTIMCAITLVLAAVLAVRSLTLTGGVSVTKEGIGQILRAETDLIRQSGDEQARGIRQELGDNLRGFQDTTIKNFAVLSEAVNTQLGTFGGRLDAGMHTIIGKLDDDIRQMGEDASKNRELLRQLIEGKLDATVFKQSEEAKALREELGGSFHRLGGNMASTLNDFGQQQKDRLEQTARALRELGEKHEKTQDAFRQTVEGRLDAIRQESASKLEEMRQTVDEKLQTTLETRLGESFNRVVEQLKSVHDGLGEMRALASNVGDLKNVLTNVKVRGTYGEVQLELLLEQFMTPEQYIRNAKVKENTSERVEFAIKLPGKGSGEEVLLPIDAKFPREAYERLLMASDSGDNSAVEEARRQIQTQIRQSAKDIRDKYVSPPRTTDFAILFLPTEGLYAEVLREPGMFEQIQRDYKVTLSGPTTLCALLNALQMGFRSLAIEKRSSEVWTVLSAVQNEFDKYNSVVLKLGKQLHTAATSVDNLGRRARAMNRTLKSVDKLPEGVDGQSILGLSDDMDDNVVDSPEPEIQIAEPATL